MSGFTYRGIHCEELGCIHMPDAAANWFQSPDFEISKEDVSWRDGSFYYYTRRKIRTFTVNCFFEGITMYGRERIRRWLDEKASGDLIFDDRPYVRYRVRPSKIVTGKIYEQDPDYVFGRKFNGTFNITFQAEDPLGYLTQLVDEDILNTERENFCNLIRTDMMPAKPGVSDTSFMIYNQGTVPCGVTFQIAGTAPNGLTIRNNTNGTRCVLRGLPEDGTLNIDSSTGLISTTSIYGTEPTFLYHDYGHLRLEPNDEMNYTGFLIYNQGSQNAEIILEVPEDLTGMYLYIDDAWNRINSMDSEGNITLARAALSSGSEYVHLAKMNEMNIAGDGVTLTTLDYSYEPRTL